MEGITQMGNALSNSVVTTVRTSALQQGGLQLIQKIRGLYENNPAVSVSITWLGTVQKALVYIQQEHIHNPSVQFKSMMINERMQKLKNRSCRGAWKNQWWSWVSQSPSY